MAVLKRKGNFHGPDFVHGLANQKNDIIIQDKKTAILPNFIGGQPANAGLNNYNVTFTGKNFGMTSDGRFKGVVEGFTAVDQNGNSWTVSGYDASLEVTNTSVTLQTFIENLLSPVVWEYHGNKTPDIFIGGSFDDVLKGKGGNDSFQGLDGDDSIYGGKGQDELNGESGNDLIYGGRGFDTLTGGRGADEIRGGKGNDLIFGNEDADFLFGNKGNDTIFGGDSGDVINGGKGSDTIFGDNGSDEINGHNGNDTIEGGAEGDKILGGKGNDSILGQDGADDIEGGRGHDEISGGNGTDVLLGGPGNDIVEGGESSDFITGGRGNDILAGNVVSAVMPDGSPDTFIFEGRFGHDVITDMEENWDGLRFLDIEKKQVDVSTVGDDVLIEVDHLGVQTILVEGVASWFDKHVDIVYG